MQKINGIAGVYDAEQNVPVSSILRRPSGEKEAQHKASVTIKASRKNSKMAVIMKTATVTLALVAIFLMPGAKAQAEGKSDSLWHIFVFWRIFSYPALTL